MLAFVAIVVLKTLCLILMLKYQKIVCMLL